MLSLAILSFAGHSNPSDPPSAPRSNLAYITPRRGNMRLMPPSGLKFLFFLKSLGSFILLPLL